MLKMTMRTSTIIFAGMLLLPLVLAGMATATAPGTCDGLSVNVQPQLYYSSGSPVVVEVGAVAEVGCALAQVPITIVATDVTNGTQQQMATTTIQSGTTGQMAMGTFSPSVYYVQFVGTGAGLTETITTEIVVLPPPCQYYAWFNDNSEGQATNFTFVPVSDCTYTITVGYDGQNQPPTTITYTGSPLTPPTDYIPLPDPNTVQVVDVTVRDSNGWVDSQNQCSSQQMVYGQCPEYINVNVATTAYPYVSNTPDHLMEGVGALVVLSIIVIYLARRKRGWRYDESDEYEADY